MLFRQAQIFQFKQSSELKISSLLPKLEALKFAPCLPSFASSCGWVAPTQVEHGPLAQQIKRYIMLCCQHEDKILPSSVVNDAVTEKIQTIEQQENRKVYAKEKRSLRDEITQNLLPKAFSKKSLVYGYIDPELQIIVLNTTQKDKTKSFLDLLKKSLSIDAMPLKLKKTSYILTQWIINDQWPDGITILDKSVLQDPNNIQKVIRSQAQDIFAQPMQDFLQQGLEIKQLGMAWRDLIEFTLSEGFLFKTIKYQDELLSEIAAHQGETIHNSSDTTSSEEAMQSAYLFDANFMIMAGALTELFTVLLPEFCTESPSESLVETPIETPTETMVD